MNDASMYRYACLLVTHAYIHYIHTCMHVCLCAHTSTGLLMIEYLFSSFGRLNTVFTG